MDLPRLREKWFYEERAYPHKQIPGNARLKALERVREMRRQKLERESRSAVKVEAAITANPTTWTPIGPRPISSRSFGLTSGRTVGMAVDPTNPDIVYIGGAQGGVWKSTDGGVTWTNLTDSQPSLAVGSIAIDPSSCTPGPCTTIYVGTGEQTYSGSSYYGAGILKSTDGGQTWTQLGQSVFVGPFSSGFSPGGGARIGSIAVSPNGQIILAGVQIFISTNSGASSGIYRSTDGGVTWTQTFSGAPGNEIVFVPGSNTNVFASVGSPACDTDNGVYRSTDGGVTWTRADATGTQKLPANTTATCSASTITNAVGRIEIAIAPSNPQVLYAGVTRIDSSSSQDDTLLGFYKSTDGGVNWTQLTNTPDYCAQQCSYDHIVRVHPNDANVVYVGGAASNYLQRSTNGGVSWTDIRTSSTGVPVHVDQHVMAFGFNGTTATRLYLGNDGGVWVADVSNPTGAISWVNLNSGLELTQFYPGISIHPATEQIGIGGSQDNGTMIFSGQLQWQEVTCGDGGFTAYEPSVPSTVYASCQSVPQFFLRRSVRNGEVNVPPGTTSWVTGLIDGIDPNDPAAFIPPLVIDPNGVQRLYFGTNRIYLTTDGMENWTPISPDLTNGGGVIRNIAVAPSDSNVVYVVTSNGRVARSLNALQNSSATWSDITTSGDLPTRTATSIAIHPSNPDFAVVTFSGFSGFSSDNKGHVFRTTNGGASWTDISGSGAGALPNTPVNAVVIDPTPPSGSVGDTLYIATDVGVFVTTDGGQNWSELAGGLPNVAVLGLALRNSSRTLRAATHGRGMWDLQLPGLPPYVLSSISPASADAGSTSTITLVARGNGFTASSELRWNGQTLPNQNRVSANEIRADITAAELASATVAQITVFDPVLGTASPALPFTVLGAVPTLTSISPTSASVSSPTPFTVTATGTNFNSATKLLFNGRQLNTTFVNSTTITAALQQSDMVGGVYTVQALNPPPGGGLSSNSPPITFRIDAPAPPNDAFSAAITAVLDAQGHFTDSQNNVSATANTGGQPDPTAPSTCTSGATANGAANSIWYRFQPTVNGAIVADTAGTAYDSLLIVVTGSPGAFTQVACDDDGIAPGGPSRVSFSATANTTYFFMISAWAGDGGATTFNLQFTSPPPNDDIGFAALVDAVPFTHVVNTAAATSQTSDPSPSCVAGAPGLSNNGRAKSVWYRFTPSAAGSITADTLNSSYDSILSVFTGLPSVPSEVACNDDDTAGGVLTSKVTFNGNANTTYYFMVSAFTGDGGATNFRITSAPAPATDVSLSLSSASLTVNRGQSASTTLTITPVGGSITTPVTFTCSNLPTAATCSFNPTSVTPNASPANVTVTITTSAGGTTAPRFSPPDSRGPLPWIPLLVGILFVLALTVPRTRRQRWARALALSSALLLLVALASCGGGGGGGGTSPPPPPPNPGTSPGTYSVNINVNFGSQVRFTTVTLTVR
jgi:photosystem II stability/assembly factor-like uncharacterized protein